MLIKLWRTFLSSWCVFCCRTGVKGGMFGSGSSAAYLAADLHSNAEVTRGRCDGSTVDGSPSRRSGCRAIASNAGVLPAHLDDGEKGAGSGPKASAGGHRAPFASRTSL